ncbi:MAG: hypothetical protein V4681_03415 [Patescibacteria group bacterium]
MRTYHPVTKRHPQSDRITMMLWFAIWMQFATAVLLALEGWNYATVLLAFMRVGVAIANFALFVGLLLLAGFLIVRGLYRLLRTSYKDVSMGLTLLRTSRNN